MVRYSRDHKALDKIQFPLIVQHESTVCVVTFAFTKTAILFSTNNSLLVNNVHYIMKSFCSMEVYKVLILQPLV